MRSHKYVISRARLAITTTISAIALALPAMAHAQSSQSSQLDARWQPWIGCWRPAPPASAGPASFSTPRSSNAPLVCIVPANTEQTASSVNVVTIANGKVVAQDTIDANGQSISRSKDHCDGVERATWSPNGRRLYVTSDYTCPGGLKRTSSGLFAISPTGDWVNVQGVSANGNKSVSTLRYTDAGKPSDLPPDVAQALNGRGLEVSTARAAAGARLTTGDVVEASHDVDPAVVEAWIVDRGQTFNIDAKQLIALSDAGVPGSVTDAMVAVSYPKAFVVNPPPGADGESLVDSASDASGTDVQRATGRNVEVMMMPAYSPYDYSPFGFAPYGYYGFAYPGYGYPGYGYAPYGYAPYGAYYSPYSGYPLGYGGLYPTNPVIVLRGPPAQHGYVVRGHGYTQSVPGSGYSTGTAQPRPSVSPPSRAPSPPPPPPPSPSPSGRTAHQRP